ncbi:hypothetical protein GIB67_029471 [Kingdonia uniflora]|uniref:Uncharacterized protein n=1 Tax=Kingdonia uniflora TaxID=39325 RepID=A0A7J7NY99_9MAGN|nr:hypothetical protein GIB67_029471 [Kingdonia uniflora]
MHFCYDAFILKNLCCCLVKDLWVRILCQCCMKDTMTKLRRSENAKCKSKSHTSETSSHVRRHEREVH